MGLGDPLCGSGGSARDPLGRREEKPPGMGPGDPPGGVRGRGAPCVWGSGDPLRDPSGVL